MSGDPVFVDHTGRSFPLVIVDEVVDDFAKYFGIDLTEQTAATIYPLLVADPVRLSHAVLLSAWRSAGWTEDEAGGSKGQEFLQLVRHDNASFLRGCTAMLRAFAVRFHQCDALRGMVQAIPSFKSK